MVVPRRRFTLTRIQARTSCFVATATAINRTLSSLLAVRDHRRNANCAHCVTENVDARVGESTGEYITSNAEHAGSMIQKFAPEGENRPRKAVSNTARKFFFKSAPDTAPDANVSSQSTVVLAPARVAVVSVVCIFLRSTTSMATGPKNEKPSVPMACISSSTRPPPASMVTACSATTATWRGVSTEGARTRNSRPGVLRLIFRRAEGSGLPSKQSSLARPLARHLF